MYKRLEKSRLSEYDLFSHYEVQEAGNGSGDDVAEDGTPAENTLQYEQQHHLYEKDSYAGCVVSCQMPEIR